MHYSNSGCLCFNADTRLKNILAMKAAKLVFQSLRHESYCHKAVNVCRSETYNNLASISVLWRKSLSDDTMLKIFDKHLTGKEIAKCFSEELP